ncbi:MAG: zinc-dependent metalloprotease, partial [Bacteroidales bacterium]
NYVAQPGDLERGVRLTPPFLGLYDYYIVKWLYEPLFIEDPFEERDYLAKWVTELSGNKIYRYGKQQLFSSCDPTSQMEDLGDDPIKASEYGIKNLKFIMENINRWLQGEDRDYIYRTEIYREIANQYLRYLGHVTTNVGGVIVNERFEGDKLPHYKIVSRDRQRASLIFLLNQIRDLEWLENMEFIRNMPLKNSIKDLVRDRLSGMIISSAKRVHFGSTKSDDPYTTKECLEDLYTNIFKSLDSKETPSKTEMKLQKDFIAEIVDAAELSSDSDTPLYALNTISKKRELIEKMQSSEPPKGFELWVLFNYDIGDYEKSLFYGYLEKTKDRVLKRMRNCSPEARLHYELLLRTIQKSIK